MKRLYSLIIVGIGVLSLVVAAQALYNKSSAGSSIYVGAADGKAFILQEADSGPSITVLKTSMPVFKAFGISENRKKLVYTPFKNDVPSGELYVENLNTGNATKVTDHFVLEAALSPGKGNQVAYTFSGGDHFELGSVDLATGDDTVLVSSDVLPDVVQWDSQGEQIYYFEAVEGTRDVSDSTTGTMVEQQPYARLSPRSARPGQSASVKATNVPSSFPVLDHALAEGEFSAATVPTEHSLPQLPQSLYSFHITSPDGTHEVFGDDLLGSGPLSVGSGSSGKTTFSTGGQLLKAMNRGVVLRTATDTGSQMEYVDWNGKVTILSTTTTTYNLPLSGTFAVTQGGQSYPSPGSCLIYDHISSSSMGYAYDMQNATAGAHVLASAPGVVVTVVSNFACNSCSGTRCADYNPSCSPTSFGNVVVIQHSDGFYTKYAHLQFNSIQVPQFSTVCQGQHIGNQGHTGCTTGASMSGCGDHLHFQKQNSALTSGSSANISFADHSNPLSCTSGLHSGSTEVSSCSQGDFSISATPFTTTISQGSSAAFAVTIQSLSNFGRSVSLDALNLPGAVLPGTGFNPTNLSPPPNGSVTSFLVVNTNTATPTGSFTITIRGRSGTLSRQTTVQLIVTASPGNIVVNAKLNGFYWPSNGSGAVNYSITGPQGTISSTFVPFSRNNLAPGQYRLTYNGGGPGTLVSVSPSSVQTLPSASTIAFTLNFTAPLNFSISTVPSSVTIARGGAATYTVTVGSINNFNGAVSLTALNIPGAVLPGTGFSPQIVSPGPGGLANSTFRVVTNSSTPRGTFTMTIKGVSGSLTNQMTVRLTIT